MTQNDPAGLELVLAEQPTGAAVLDIQLGPDLAARATGSVPSEYTPLLIAASGIVGCVISGITGMVLTLHIAASLIGPAYAELGLALAGALMIAARRAPALKARRRGADPGRYPADEQ